MTFTPAQLLALVQDVVRYPEFMPGCIAATVEKTEGDVVRAGLRFRFAGLSESFVTENHTTMPALGHMVLRMRLLRGPFKSLAGEWRFQALGDAACKVSLVVDLDWGALSLGRLLAPQLDRAITKIMTAFTHRAEVLHGKPAERI